MRFFSNGSLRVLVFTVPESMLSQLPVVNLGEKSPNYQRSHLHIRAQLSRWLSASYFSQLLGSVTACVTGKGSKWSWCCQSIVTSIIIKISVYLGSCE